MRLLTSGDPETERHFHAYFTQCLALMLRARHIDADAAADVIQETLYRVIRILRQGKGVDSPERFGAFVTSVSRNVLLETGRRAAKRPDSIDDSPEFPDRGVDAELSLITEERKQAVRKVLDSMPQKHREILRLVFFEQLDRDEICRRMNIEPGHLRVLLHRAKAQFVKSATRNGKIDPKF